MFAPSLGWRACPLDCKNEYLVFELGAESAGSCRLYRRGVSQAHKPRNRETSDRSYALHNVCSQLFSFPFNRGKLYKAGYLRWRMGVSLVSAYIYLFVFSMCILSTIGTTWSNWVSTGLSYSRSWTMWSERWALISLLFNWHFLAGNLKR